MLLAQVGPPAPFILDDDNHVVSVAALRAGGFTIPGTQEVSPSRELFWFDPVGNSRSPDARAVSTLPPIYAVLAQPFAALGWRGLIGLQSAAFLFTLGLLAWVERRRLVDPRVPWVAVATLALGAYLLEYAIGLWPHMLSMALVTVAFVLVSEGLGKSDRRLGLRLAAGLMMGLAIGVRYQNVAYALGLSLGLLFFSRHRLREIAAFGVGLSPPLIFSALVNHARLGTYNPITKGGSYLTIGVEKESWPISVAYAVMSRIFDSSLTPDWALKNQPWWSRDPRSGAVMHAGALKKAWLQSLPWAVLPLMAMMRAWLRPRAFAKKEDVSVERSARSEKGGSTTSDILRWGSVIDLRLISLVISSVLGVILSFGVRRHDGLCFNQRYFIELTPLLVHGLAIALDRFDDPRWLGRVIIGVSIGVLMTSFLLFGLSSESMGRHLLLLRVPLILAILVGGAWHFRSYGRGVLGLLLGLALGWAAGVHFFGDISMSLETRGLRHDEGIVVSEALPRNEAIALFVYWGSKDALGPLMLSRDIVIADAHNDEGATAPKLVREFLAQGRRVFVIVNGFSRVLAEKMGEGLKVVSNRSLQIPGRRWPWILVELGR